MILKNISYINSSGALVKNVNIRIENSIFKSLNAEIIDGEKTIDCTGMLAISGLCNAHTHLAMSLMRGYGENLSLSDWLNKRIFPYEDKLTDDAVYAGVMLSVAESLKYGVTSLSDMYFFMDGVLRALNDSKIKANISRSIVSFDDTPLKDNPRFIEAIRCYEKVKEQGLERIKSDMSLHAEYTNTYKTIEQFAELTNDMDAVRHIHLSETADEVAACKKRYNLSPVELMEKCGVFDKPTLAAHCVHLSSSDMDILQAKNVTVATCPVSNLKLASGICNVGALNKRGICVAIGTDSSTSNNNLNMMYELKLVPLLVKGTTGNPTAITPFEAYKMATENGAIAQNRRNCGSIKIGNRADLAIIDLNAPNMQPVHDALTNVVYSMTSDNVVMTIVDGEILYDHGKFTTIDIERSLALVNEYNDKILASL